MAQGIGSECGDVLGVLAQGWQADGLGTEAGRDVLSKRADFAVGRGDNLHVNLAAFGGSERLQLSVFEKPEQLRLDFLRDLGKLVQKKQPHPPNPGASNA